VVDGVDGFHREVITALAGVIVKHGFALAGGGALLAHGLSHRPTRDVNLFSDRDGAVAEVADQVEAALRKTGFHAERVDTFGDLLEQFPDMADYRAEWTVAKNRQQVILQIGISSPRLRPPVQIMGLGPVLDVDDILAGKVLAAITRAEPRDYIDIGHALSSYTPEQLIQLAWKLEPNAYAYQDFTSVPVNLDELEDEAFAEFEFPGGIVGLRERFAQWPRYLG
jgi:hypothetical protein